MRLILLGAPGAGKGTLAGLLKSSLNIEHISTGDLLREEMKNNTEIGLEVKKYIDQGALVPDEVVTRMIEKKIVNQEVSKKGYMLDGFPRNESQAKDLTAILERIKQPLSYAIFLQSTLPVVIRRLTGRRVCRDCGATYHVSNRPPKVEGTCDECGKSDLYQRADDNEETIKKRMEVYLQTTIPIVEYYKKQGILRQVDGDDEAENILEILLKGFDEDREQN